MDLKPASTLYGFTVIDAEDIPEIDGRAYTLTHEKSGAKLLYLANADDNKAFSIAFRTPPADDTGVFHILEHSVLCGSEKFPVKEPFVNLLKTSMQTFLNAMTFGDKTLYPVASTNDQDLINLADVYLDAVLHPDIYRYRQIFEQEGWHFERTQGALADPSSDTSGDKPGQAPVTFNGVVYNEMKGALSDATSVLYDELQASLFPDTSYAFESGGTPEAIPTLTYEHYLEEHERHYRLDNSYLTLYGNVDAERMLKFLDERYLTPVAAEQAHRDEERAAAGLTPLTPRTIALQSPVKRTDVVRRMATAPENACMGLGFVVGHARERTRIVACDILLDAIAGSNEAPLRRAILDAQLAGDVVAYMADAIQQPFATIQVRDLKPGCRESLLRVVLDELGRLADGGLDHALVEASIARDEFIMREADFGMADGVALTITALNGWLYGDELATTYLKYESDFAFLRKALDEGYFEELIRSLFLDNAHMAQVEVLPDEDAGDDEAARAAKASADFTEEDLARIDEEVALLRRRQEQPDSPEALSTLPQLHVSDIGPAPAEAPYALLADAPVPCIRHDVPTRGIAYAYRYYDLGGVEFEELPYVSILATMLGKLDTDEHSASDIDTLTNGKLGSFSVFTEVYEREDDPRSISPKFIVGASSLAKGAEWLGQLPTEILASTDFSDTEKIRAALEQRRVGMEHGFANNGHAAAMARAASYYSPAGLVRQQLGGVEFYRFLKKLLAEFDTRGQELAKKLSDLAKRLFTPENLTVSFTGGDTELATFWEASGLAGGSRIAGEGRCAQALATPQPSPAREAFIVPTDVCYAALAADRRAFAGKAYTGVWSVAARALSYDYLWNEVRVKGGAYGAGFQATRTGGLRFYSYRDPHLDETVERFKGAATWLDAFNPTADEMDGYVVSSVAGFDTPVKTRALIRRQDGAFFSARVPGDRTKARQEIIEATPEKLHALANDVRAAAQAGMLCVFGNKAILENSKLNLSVIDLLNE